MFFKKVRKGKNAMLAQKWLLEKLQCYISLQSKIIFEQKYLQAGLATLPLKGPVRFNFKKQIFQTYLIFWVWKYGF